MTREGMPCFSDAEMARRHEAIIKLMEADNLDAMLIFAHSGTRRHSQADIHYVTGVAPFHEGYALIVRAGTPVLWVSHYNHLASAKAFAAIEDVRRAAKQAGGQLAKEIAARGLAQGRIGLVGNFYYHEMDTLRSELSQVIWRDANASFRLLRARKSQEELNFQKIAATACDAVMQAIGDAIRPGVEERDLLVLSEEVAWKSGCEPYFLYLNSTPMAASTSCVPNQNITRRKLALGDVINTELTVSYGLYCAQILRPFFLGEPTREYAKLYDVTKKVHDRLAELIRPGVDMLALHEASGMIEDAGLTTVDSVLHGFAVDIVQPNMRSKGFDAPPPFGIERDMTIVIQPNATTHDERAGVQLGQTGLVTDQGFVSMHALPAEVRQCA